jgi:acetoin utilization deacetylase AcuC-like enzyme
MITVYGEDHRLHEGRQEFHRGKMHPCFERPERAELVIQRIRERNWDIIAPNPQVDLRPLFSIHQPRYLDFLQTIHEQWHAMHPDEDAIAHVWSCRGFRQVEPKSIYGKLGYYSFDAGTPITAGTWRAAIAAVRTTLTAQQLIQAGAKAAFALTRPPGHHAGPDFCGGYCFCNNAAIAAAAFLQSGVERVAILDIDFHHGNGTQRIFYDRKEVLFVSLHGDPAEAYPYFLGYRDEIGEGGGTGFNINYPLPIGTDGKLYETTLLDALAVIGSYKPGRLVVSLGVDTFIDDPISGFRLETDDFTKMGSLLGQLRFPTLFVMEGGYYPKLGDIVAGVLGGFDEAAK